jgi:hypothetical protein
MSHEHEPAYCTSRYRAGLLHARLHPRFLPVMAGQCLSVQPGVQTKLYGAGIRDTEEIC